MNHSISRRLAAMFAVVALFVFTLVGTGLFLVLRTQLEHHLRESLDTRAEIARLIVLHAATPDKWNMAKEKLADITPRDGSHRSSPYRARIRASPMARRSRAVSRSAVPGGYVRLRPNGRAYDMLTTTHHRSRPYGERPPVQSSGRDRLLAERAHDARLRLRARRVDRARHYHRAAAQLFGREDRARAAHAAHAGRIERESEQPLAAPEHALAAAMNSKTSRTRSTARSNGSTARTRGSNRSTRMSRTSCARR